MARRDPGFTSADVIRMWTRNLRAREQRAVLAYFWGLHPDLASDTRLVAILIQLLGLIPGISEIAKYLEISQSLANIVTDVAQLFGPKREIVILDTLETLELLRLTQEALENCLTDLSASDTLVSELRQTIQDQDFRISVLNDRLSEIEAEVRAEERILCQQRIQRETADLLDIIQAQDEQILSLIQERSELRSLRDLYFNRAFITWESLLKVIVEDPTPLSILEDNPEAIPPSMRTRESFLAFLSTP